MVEEKIGMIVKGVGGLYEVRPLSLEDEEQEPLFCRARGVFRHEKISPYPGDHVRLLPENDGSSWVIDEIMPRRNVLIRPAMANVTHLMIVLPTMKPQPDLLTMDKLISISEYLNIEPIIVVNKWDLDPNKGEEIKAIYEKSGFTVFAVSAKEEMGMDAIRSFFTQISNKGNEVICAFAGLSGVGKSTLVAHLFPEIQTKTGDVSLKTEHGKHTTRQVELYAFEDKKNFYLADTPGFSMIDFTRFNFFPSQGLSQTFREFAKLTGECRYSKCTHTKEEGCAVLAAVKEGSISKSRHDSYITLFEEFKAKPDWKRKQEGIMNH